MEKIKLGMVGGGEGAFIGEVHRIAARMDERFQLCAGALCSDPERSLKSALDLGLPEDRSYSDYKEMAISESQRDDGINFVSIVTPNHLHHPIAKAFLEVGINVICDKPMTMNSEEAQELIDISESSDLIFAVTYNYSGYPLIREAREIIKKGELGSIRIIKVEYIQDWLTEPIENTGQKQASWRVDPKKSGIGGSIGDIGTHAFHLAHFVTQQLPNKISADLSCFVEGRELDDNAHILMRYESGAKGMIWSSQVAPGNENNLKIQIYGEKGGLIWQQENPNELILNLLNQPSRRLTRGSSFVGDQSARLTRIPAGHPEGYLEGFANIYREVADEFSAKISGKPISKDILYPTSKEGLYGVSFIEAAIESNSKDSVWTDLKL
ncbi:MAG: oxidoreductase [Gammaproteobacteria bacterium]|nr:oxidoreductase [Gammaproteobacteria bacterium]|tara:strand:- start:1397 stop:2542 length:1146 start_codon:yes stop_codon:yes gene_type:complete